MTHKLIDCPLDEEGEQHSHHLCDLVVGRQMKTVARLAADARYLCPVCGRAAARPENLCEPVELRDASHR